MPSPCKTTKQITGLFVTVLSGDGTTEVCTLGTRTDVHHRIEVKNLGGYPANLKCRGSISSGSPVVQFDSPRYTDSATAWSDSYAGLPPTATKVFDDVGLLPVSSSSSGTEIILADLDVTWMQPGRTRSVSLHIDVAT